MAAFATAFGIALLGSPDAGAACTMANAEPDSGTLTLQYLGPSTKNSDRNDYRLSGTVRWNSSAALACFSAGHIDWSYESNLTYQSHFDRKIWSPDFSAFPAASSPYIDTTAEDNFSNTTDLTFGIFRPDALKAGVDYRFAYSLFLPRRPSWGYQSLYLAGQVIQRSCSRPGPWCVGIPPLDKSYGEPFIGTRHRFDTTGTTCLAWHRGGQSPTPCPSRGGSNGGGSTGTSGGAPGAPGSAQVSLAQGPAAPAGYRYAISLSGFAANTAIPITCYDSVDPGGFYNFSLTTDGTGRASTASYCYSGDGPDHWVVAGGVQSNHVSWGAGAPSAPSPATWSEQETPNHPVNTFTNYHNASGMGPAIAAGQWVQVACKVYDPTIQSVNPDGYWYRIASTPWNGAYYSPANTFMNGDPYGGPYTHNTDFAVPNC
ncbi:MAG TPA: hypothetical protein VF085_04750 [Solirubrobacterales bacterium]